MTLNKIRSTSNNIFFQIFLFAIVISFVIVGISDIFTSKGKAIATVGREPISEFDFFRSKEMEIRRIQQMMGSKPSEEMLKSFNIDNIVLSKLIEQKLLENEAKDLGFSVSNEFVSKQIRENSVFFDKNNRFDKDLFIKLLANNDLTEAKYIEALKNETAMNYLNRLIVDTEISNPIMKDSFVRFLKEEARVNLVTLTNNNDNYPVSAQEVADYYKLHEKDFFSPEYRKIKYFAISEDIVNFDANFSDEDLKKEYEDNILSYSSPESRDAINLLFASEDEARKAKEILLKSKDFLVDGKKLLGDKAGQEVVLKNITRSSFDNALSDQIFLLPVNVISAPIKSDFGYHLIKVTKINQEANKRFEEVKSALKEALIKQRRNQEFLSVLENMEDELSAGANIEEVAKKYNIAINSTDYVSKNGLDNNGKEVKLPKLDNFLENAFDVEEKVDSQLYASDVEKIYFALRVDELLPAKLKELQLVNEQIVSIIKAQKKEIDTSKNVNLFYDEIKAANFVLSSELESKYKKIGFGIEKKDNLVVTRVQDKEQNSVPEELVLKIFIAGENEFTTPAQITPNRYLLAQLKSISLPKNIDSNFMSNIDKEIEESLKKQSFEEFMNYLYLKYGVKINVNFSNKTN